MPTINDYFAKAANDTKDFPVVATVAEERAVKGDTLKLDSLAGWSTTTPVHFMSYSLKDGTIDLASQSDWKGIVDADTNTITHLTLTRGEDKGHKVGDQIVLNPTAGWLEDLVNGLGVTLNQDGTLKDDIVKAQNIESASFSEEEQVVGKWTDGKTLYRRTFDIGLITSGVSYPLPDGGNYETIFIDMAHSFIRSSSNSLGLQYYTNSSDSIRVWISGLNTNAPKIIVAVGQDFIAQKFNMTVTICYTKKSES